MSDFHKYWDDLKKHEKRVDYWLPHLRQIGERLGGRRPLRYFTLCAFAMVDVFMLIRENLLAHNNETGRVDGVQFCECDGEVFTVIRDLIAREDAGFLGFVENIALFEDDDFSGQFPTEDSIEIALTNDEVLANDHRGDRLRLKRTHRLFKASFPFDYINLDFCERYYSEPPDVLKINNTIRRFLEWQLMPSEDGTAAVEDFVMAVTCRLDDRVPAAAQNRLINLVRDNCTSSAEYRQAYENGNGAMTVHEWVSIDKNSFFLAAWPKDIAHVAQSLHWRMDILDYVFYDRTGDRGNDYLMVCLVARFTKAEAVPDYMPAALHALDPNKRVHIVERSQSSPKRRALWTDLKSVVEIRNGQVSRVGREDPLPEPKR